MCKIECKVSKNGKNFLVLCVNDVYVSFDRMVIERVAMSVGVSNIELSQLSAGEHIKI